MTLTIRLVLILILTMSAVARPSTSEVRFASGKSALSIPFKLHNNLIYLQLRVNNRLLNFILDTGAPHIINTRQAQALGLQLKPAGRTTGAGESEVDLSTADNVTFGLPGVTLSGQSIAVVSLENVEECTNRITAYPDGRILEKPQAGVERQVVDGVLGHQFFTHFVVEIDYARQHINVYERASYKYSGPGEIIPLEIVDNHIFIRAHITAPGHTPLNGRFMPLAGRFMIDTGAATALILTSPFIKTNNLILQTQPALPLTGCGIGGDTKALMSTIGDLQLGKLNIATPVTMFSQAKSGSLASSDYAGLIGNAILRHYKVIFDYPHNRMILETTGQ
jgi:predicted aspartyl protease